MIMNVVAKFHVDLPKSAAQLPLVNPVEADPPKEADAFPHAGIISHLTCSHAS